MHLPLVPAVPPLGTCYCPYQTGPFTFPYNFTTPVPSWDRYYLSVLRGLCGHLPYEYFVCMV